MPASRLFLNSLPVMLTILYHLQIKEFEGKETAQLVDRYKFLDLFPCTPSELRYENIIIATLLLLHSILAIIHFFIFCLFLCRSIGYNMVTASKTYHSANGDGDDEPASLPKPDLSQMVPFKPKYKSIPGDHPVSGM